MGKGLMCLINLGFAISPYHTHTYCQLQDQSPPYS
nr:MAG TPA: hypothetical protein [Caudoviricetes sp.]